MRACVIPARLDAECMDLHPFRRTNRSVSVPVLIGFHSCCNYGKPAPVLMGYSVVWNGIDEPKSG